MAFLVWVYRLIVLLSIMWLRRRCAARRRLRLTIEMAWEVRNRRHKTARARIRLLLFESKSRRLSTAYLQRIAVWERYRSRSFGTKLLGIGVRGNRDRLYAHNSLLLTRVEPSLVNQTTSSPPFLYTDVPSVTQRIKWPADGWGLVYETRLNPG